MSSRDSCVMPDSSVARRGGGGPVDICAEHRAVCPASASAATMPVASPPPNPNHSASDSAIPRQPSYGMDANTLADYLGVAPAYMHAQNERWSSAALQYQEMLTNAGSRDSPNTPERQDSNPILTNALSEPKGIPGVFRKHGSGAELEVHCPKSWSGMLTPGSFGQKPTWSMGGSRMESRGEPSQNSLELEAIAAVHELSFAVEAISVSEMLPRTEQLIFVNVTTVEGRPYCLELTFKGWRVTSLRHDCMNGDYNQIALHTRYFETPYALMDHISSGYKQRFGEKLAARLRLLETNEGCAAPPSSFVNGGAFPEEWDTESSDRSSREQTKTPPRDQQDDQGLVLEVKAEPQGDGE